MLHMPRNARMEFEIDNCLLGKGNGQSPVDLENLKSDQDINMVFGLWRWFDATQHGLQFLFEIIREVVYGAGTLGQSNSGQTIFPVKL